MELINNRKIRWGIIGLGKIAHKFASDLLTVDDAELYAVASRSQEKANEFASEYQSTKAYSSYEALANDSNIDAVYIATPHVFHKENSLMCLKKGIAVLCEKPFAMNSEEVNEMIECAKSNKVLLMEALWTAFLPHYQYVLELIRNQTLGKVLELKADFGFDSGYDLSNRVINKSLGGGSLLDIGIYPIFAALTALGSPKEIEASATFFENKVDSSCSMIFKYDNDVRAYLFSSLMANTPTEAVIKCENGTIRINSRFHQPTSVTIIKNGKEETKEFGYSTNGYSFEIQHFNHLLKSNKTESDIMTFDFSKTVITTLDKVRQIIGLDYK